MYRVLIAEDEPRIASFIQKGLKANGFTVAISTNARETLNLTLGTKFDLLVLDLGLPDQDGLEVLEALRGQGETLPIIILTARDDIHDKVKGLESGADDYMTKRRALETISGPGCSAVLSCSTLANLRLSF